jgi:hypothetical protein
MRKKEKKKHAQKKGSKIQPMDLIQVGIADYGVMLFRCYQCRQRASMPGRGDKVGKVVLYLATRGYWERDAKCSLHNGNWVGGVGGEERGGIHSERWAQ